MTGWPALLVLASVLLWPGRRPLVRRGPGPWSLGWRWPAQPAPGWRRAGSSDAPRPDEVADALVLVVLVLRSGAALTEAVGAVAAASPRRVRRDLTAVVAALRWGVPVPEAWGYAGASWRPAALAFQMAAATGASPIGLLLEAGVRIRVEREQDQTRRAARAGVLLVLPLGLGFLPAFACTAVIPVVLALAGSVLGS
jgi:pilus assembly protein TadC